MQVFTDYVIKNIKITPAIKYMFIKYFKGIGGVTFFTIWSYYI